jgi:hypothetical protein
VGSEDERIHRERESIMLCVAKYLHSRYFTPLPAFLLLPTTAQCKHLARVNKSTARVENVQSMKKLKSHDAAPQGSNRAAERERDKNTAALSLSHDAITAQKCIGNGILSKGDLMKLSCN